MTDPELLLFEARYGQVINMLKVGFIDRPNIESDVCSAAVKLWKATRLPIPYISIKLGVDKKKLDKMVMAQIAQWKAAGSVPKNDVLGEAFSKFFPELCCIRYTMEEISNMKKNCPDDIRIGEVI